MSEVAQFLRMLNDALGTYPDCVLCLLFGVHCDGQG
jgi:hypothetical protein